MLIGMKIDDWKLLKLSDSKVTRILLFQSTMFNEYTNSLIKNATKDYILSANSTNTLSSFSETLGLSLICIIYNPYFWLILFTEDAFM